MAAMNRICPTRCFPIDGDMQVNVTPLRPLLQFIPIKEHARCTGSILRQSGLSWRKCLWTILPAHLLTSLLVLTGFLFVFDFETIGSDAVGLPVPP